MHLYKKDTTNIVELATQRHRNNTFLRIRQWRIQNFTFSRYYPRRYFVAGTRTHRPTPRFRNFFPREWPRIARSSRALRRSPFLSFFLPFSSRVRAHERERKGERAEVASAASERRRKAARHPRRDCTGTSWEFFGVTVAAPARSASGRWIALCMRRARGAASSSFNGSARRVEVSEKFFESQRARMLDWYTLKDKKWSRK